MGEQQNSSLRKQLSQIKAFVAHKLPGSGITKNAKAVNATTGTCLMMVVFSCCFLMFPANSVFNSSNSVGHKAEYEQNMRAVNSRTLLKEVLNERNEKEFFNSIKSAGLPDEQRKTPSSGLQNVPSEGENSFGSPAVAPKARELETANYDDLVNAEHSNKVFKSVNFSETVNHGIKDSYRHKDL